MYENFDKLLKDFGVTRYQVSKATGVPQSSLSDWSKGKSKPKYENMKKLADYFGVSVDYLLGNSDEKEKPAAVQTISDAAYAVAAAYDKADIGTQTAVRKLLDV